jgi:N-methylhydantoinase B
MYDRTEFAARGLFGGRDGAMGAAITSDGRRLHSKQRLLLDPATEVILQLPGGAGYGDPREREPARVLEDVRQGYVSVEAARRDYGLTIDEAAGRPD